MPPDQESDLVWFFGPGQSEFEKSTCGSMLESLERSSCTSKRCSTCNGQGIIGGDDFTAPGYGDWCGRCKGIGTLPVSLKRAKGQLTVKPKSPSGNSNARTPADRALTRYASVSRRINKLQETCPKSVQILAAYYGNAGTGWAQTTGYTRLFPVISLSQAGFALLKRYVPQTVQLEEGGTYDPKEAHEQLGQMHKMNTIKQDSNVTKLFQEGFLQAEQLLDIAILDWLEAA